MIEYLKFHLAKIVVGVGITLVIFLIAWIVIVVGDKINGVKRWKPRREGDE